MLKFFPVKPSVVAEIGKLLSELCRDDQEARSLVGVLLENHSEWPGPSRLRQVHAEEIASRRTQDLPDGCALCEGSGFRAGYLVIEHVPEGTERKHVFYRNEVTPAEMWERYGKSPQYDFFDAVAYPCSCPLGRRRKAEQEQTSR
jgi:hypothetical protein